MATQITHLVLTDKVYDKYFSQHNKAKFVVGTIFPDIQYLGVLNRDATHQEIKKLAEIDKADSFKAGIQFHNLVDAVRENFVVARNIYSYCPPLERPFQIPKLLEDEILYDKVKNWPEYQSYLDKILPEELAMNVPEGKIKIWHKMISDYIGQRPTDETRIQWEVDAGKTTEHQVLVNGFIDNIRNNPEVRQIINDLYDNFENLVEKGIE
jgi:hypothetical protein